MAVGGVYQQFKYLLYRNVLLKSRKLNEAIQELLMPLYMVAILVVLAIVIPTTTFPAEPSGTVVPIPYKTLYLPSPLVIGFIPGNNANVASIMSRITNNANLTAFYQAQLIPFENDLDAETYYLQGKPGGLHCVVEFNVNPDGSLPPDILLTLRFNGSIIPSTSTMQLAASACRGVSFCEVYEYLTSGFMDLEIALTDSISQELLNVPLSVSGFAQSYPKAEYTSQSLVISSITAIYMVIAFSPLVQFLMVNIVQEKEKKIKEGMAMMGLRESSYFLAWFVFYAMLMTVTTLFMSAMAVFGGIFPTSNMFLIWIMLFLYGMSMIAYGFCLTPFFGNAKVAGAVGSLATVVISIIYVPLSGTGFQANSSAKWALSLLSPVALSLGVGEAISKEAAEEGLNFQNFAVGSLSPGYSAAAAMFMLLLDVAFYFVLAWYLDSVVPTEYGTKRKPWFIFDPSYWTGKQSQGEMELKSESIPPSDDVEEVPNEIASTLAVDIRHLRKVYPRADYLEGSKEKVAIDDVSLQMYEGQIFGLLGHNGAGKTTLISILSGLFSATSGQGRIFGLDISKNMHEIRGMMGVCPQHNILFDELTVREHLVIFAGIKGVASENLNAEVDRILSEIDLADSGAKRSSTLSGGQKRKLSVGMALIGDPRLIFLDEPTAGMDPYSRRKLWDLLQKSKKGRVVLITSHFLDEIDILADRKAILSHGLVRCCGSSLFLKTRFGLGYYLSIDKAETCDPKKVFEVVQSIIPSATMDKFTGAELAFRLPLSEVKTFPLLFTRLDSSLEELGIIAYAISMTSLEEVFLRLEHDDAEADNTLLTSSEQTEINKRLEPIATTHSTEKEQFAALSFAKLRQVLRNPKAYLFVVLLPVLFLVVGMVIYTVTPSSSNEFPAVQLTNLYGNSLSTPAPVVNATITPIDSLLQNLPYAYILQPASSSFYPSLLNESSSAAIQISAYATSSLTQLVFFNTQNLHTLPAFWSMTSSAAFAAAAQSQGKQGYSITVVSHPLPFTGVMFDTTSYFAILLIGMALAFAPGAFAVEIVRDREKKIKHQLSIMGLKPVIYWTASFVRDIALYSIPGLLIIVLVPAFNITAFNGIALLPLLIAILAYMPAVIFFGYVVSFLFTSSETCVAIMPAIGNILSTIPYFVVSALDQSGLRQEAKIIHYCILAVDPFYGLMGALHYIYMIQVVSSLTRTPITMADYFDPANNVSGTILMMVVHLIISIATLWAIEFFAYRKPVKSNEEKEEQSERRSLLAAEEEGMDANEDSDVRLERSRAEAFSSSLGLSEFDRKNMIAVHNLTKTFPTKEEIKEEQDPRSCGLCKESKMKEKAVVKGMTLGVRPGECFGLLGPNGAGKTTTLAMITGEVMPTRGYSVVAQHDTRTEMREAFDKMGYCPQFDALFDDLTCKEHLVLYSAIKGVPKHLVEDRVSAFLQSLSIVEYTDKVARDLSGGTKRKLSFCIAMIGSPSVAVLDEPSTGMDPSSRRFMWDVILENVKGRAAILTTHSMEEADALCSRIAIMVKGKLECLGTSQHLKAKFGDGYTLEVKVPIARVDEIKQFMLQAFPAHSIVEEYAGRISFKIPQKTVSLAEVFSALEKQKEASAVEEYSFSQTTLEQVFLAFAKKQEQEAE